VGIGTTSPKTRLQSSAGGVLNAPSLGSSSTNAPLYLTNNDTAYGLVVGNNSADGHVWLQAQRTDGTATAYNITLNEAGGNVGIGQSSPDAELHIGDGSGASDNTRLRLTGGTSGQSTIQFGDTASANIGQIQYDHSSNDLVFRVNAGTRATLDASGNLLVGKTASNVATEGAEIRSSGFTGLTVDGGAGLTIRRLTSDGELQSFFKDTTKVGQIGTLAGFLTVGTGDTGIIFQSTVDNIQPLNLNTNGDRDNAIDIGDATNRFKNLYLGGGVVFGATGGNVTGKTLDDYEEGSWTPFISGASTTGTGTYSTQVGRYVKVGKKVNCWGILVSNSTHTGTGTLQISGFPFTKENSVMSWGTETSIAYFYGLSSYGTATDTIRLLGPVSNSTYARFHSFNNRGDTSAPPVPGNFVSGASMYFSATYEVQ
jgi:hypothetical protein